jgi:hypothetical protein
MNEKFHLKNLFYLDYRSLAIARILFGILLLVDLIKRSTDLKLHYTNDGVLPVSFLIENDWHPGYFSIHTLSGSIEWQVLLFIIHGLFALTLILGFKSKISLFICWLLLISLQNRNPLVLNSGDTYFRLLLFWCLFLPIGYRYSIDAIKSNTDFSSQKFYNLGSFAFILQIMLIYIVGVLFKNSYEWLHDGTAIYYALSLEQMVKPLGSWLLNFPDLLRILTFGTILVELIAPILFIAPFKNSLLRMMGIMSLISLHIGIEFTLHVGIFSFISIAALITLVPTEVWERVEIGRNKNTPEYTFTNNRINYLKHHKYINSILSICIAGVLIWNFFSIPYTPEFLSDKFKKPFYTLRLDQNWSMFAPTVLKSDGWYVFEGTLENGSKVDIFRNELIYDTDYKNNKPEYVFKQYKNSRWRKYLEQINRKEDASKYYDYLLIALMADWNYENDGSLEFTRMIFISKVNQPIGFESQKHELILKKKAQ